MLIDYTTCMSKPKKPKVMTWQPTVEDRKLMDELKGKTGIMADSEIIRVGLRALAEKEARATNG